MQFTVHRSGPSGHLGHEDDSEYDSLWSESDSETGDDRDEPEEEDDFEEDDGFQILTPVKETARDRSVRRQSALADLEDKAKSRSRFTASPQRANVQTNEDEIEQLQSMIHKWSVGNFRKYQDQLKRDNEYVTEQINHHKVSSEDQMRQLRQNIDSITSKRRSLVQEMIEERKWLAMLIQKEKEEEERKKREEEERRRREEEERRRKEEEERRRKEEEERKRIEEEKKRAEEQKKRIEEEKRIEEARKEEERKSKEAEAKRKKEEVEQKLKEEAERQAKGSGFSSHEEIEKEFLKNRELIASIKADINEPVKQNPDLRKYTFNAKRQIKPKLGQLTNSMEKILTLVDEIEAVINEAKAQNELAYRWLLNFLAKSVVQQAEAEVAVKTDAAQPLGILTVQAMVRLEGFTELLIARFIKKCPHLIGYTNPLKTEEQYTLMGWKRRDDKWEDEGQYSERIGGMVSVWAVITHSKFTEASNRTHPYPISHAWKFLARQLNKDPQYIHSSDFSAVAAWWDISATRFLQAFGKQGEKLLDLAWDAWTDSVKDRKYPSAARLRLLGEEWKKTGVACKGLPRLNR
ncbi:mRNA export factor Gle1p [Trichomonascus vanleenenianus]|uniref:mRNA export factor Gle1p n=1 Tax=Trichomonascus vanleenenianus TaxID=2268995 RepID=UPI003EC97EEB